MSFILAFPNQAKCLWNALVLEKWLTSLDIKHVLYVSLECLEPEHALMFAEIDIRCKYERTLQRQDILRTPSYIQLMSNAEPSS
jgi:hypothetical protein